MGPSPAPVPASPSTAASGVSPIMGTLAVGAGPEERGTEVLIDGTPLGLAPKYFTIPVGTHSVMFRRDGVTSRPQTIEVLASHTRSTPLRLSVPSP